MPASFAAVGTCRQNLFDGVQPEPADALLQLIGMYARDPRAHKIDVGVGVFRDDFGETPVLKSVKLAEQELLQTEDSKSYLGAEGDLGFTHLLTPIVFGVHATHNSQLRGIQTPGGTGALRLAFEFVAGLNPNAKIWVGSPTWANHVPIINASHLRPKLHAYFDGGSGVLDFDAMVSSLSDMARGDVMLLHGCCHNPTGADFKITQWLEIAKLLETRGVLPLVDLAYQGLGEGLEPDAAGMRCLLDTVPEALIAYSCDKNFGLYRERVGGLWVKAANEHDTELAFSKLLSLARCLWSMPPSHGAAVVRTILEGVDLQQLWQHELGAKRERLSGLRAKLSATHPRLEPLAHQRGMFATLPLSPADVTELRQSNAIYMAGSGRINIAGLRDDTIRPFAEAIIPFLTS
jgi:aromatic-amino-acid transaminase